MVLWRDDAGDVLEGSRRDLQRASSSNADLSNFRGCKRPTASPREVRNAKMRAVQAAGDGKNSDGGQDWSRARVRTVACLRGATGCILRGCVTIDSRACVTSRRASLDGCVRAT